jgi:hypothetical protein
MKEPRHFNAFIAVLQMGSSIIKAVQEEDKDLVRAELAGLPEWCDGMTAQDVLQRAYDEWPRWTRDMRLAIGSSMAIMYEAVALLFEGHIPEPHICDCSNIDCELPVREPTHIAELCLDRCDEHGTHECCEEKCLIERGEDPEDYIETEEDK